jgi:hypothetical protein
LLKEEAQQVQKRSALANALHDSKDDQRPAFQKQLNALRDEHDYTLLQLEGLASQILTLERELHFLLAQAYQTALRLFLAYSQACIQQEFQQLQERVHPSLRESLHEQISQVAIAMFQCVEAQSLQPPALPYMVLDNLTPSNLTKPWPIARQEAMQMLLQLSEQLSDCMIQILDRLEAQHFDCPSYFLGPLEEPEAQPLPWQQPEKVYFTSEERAD